MNTVHNRTVDCNTVSCSSKIIQTESRFNGKFMIVPITVSLIASFHAALSVHVTIECVIVSTLAQLVVDDYASR